MSHFIQIFYQPSSIYFGEVYQWKWKIKLLYFTYSFLPVHWSFHFSINSCGLVIYFQKENFKTKIGLFTLREEADKDDISIGSYFSKKSQNNPMKTTSLAASARDATSSILSSALSSPASSESKKTQHLSTFTPKRDYVATPKREKMGQSDEKLGSKGENISTKQLLPNKVWN